MGKIVSNISMSLDGFVSGPNDDVSNLFKWYFSGDKEFPVQNGRLTLKVSSQSAVLLDEAIRNTGAMLTGRRNFDGAGAWGGYPPFAPCVVMTHNPPSEWVTSGSPFIFVTDGIENAVHQAKQAAAGKDVAVATPSMTQQCLKAGQLDEITVDLVPVLLGHGLRLFEYLGIEPIELEKIRVVDAPGVTHMAFRVIKN